MKKKIAFALLMGIATTGVVSFTLISLNLGFGERFLTFWMRSWGIAYIVAVPSILIMGPRVQQLVEHLFREAADK